MIRFVWLVKLNIYKNWRIRRNFKITSIFGYTRRWILIIKLLENIVKRLKIILYTRISFSNLARNSASGVEYVVDRKFVRTTGITIRSCSHSPATGTDTVSVFHGVGLTGVTGSAVANFLGIEPHCALNRPSRLRKPTPLATAWTTYTVSLCRIVQLHLVFSYFSVFLLSEKSQVIFSSSRSRFIRPINYLSYPV